MSCEPLTCCSIEAATDCATTSALAPGKLVVTVTWGGTTCGYCAIGRPAAASTPTRIMISAMTVEKTGRSMKKLNTADLDDLSGRIREHGRLRKHLCLTFWLRQAKARQRDRWPQLRSRPVSLGRQAGACRCLRSRRGRLGRDLCRRPSHARGGRW